MVHAEEFCAVLNKCLNDHWGSIENTDGQLWTEDKQAETEEGSPERKFGERWIGKHVADDVGLVRYALVTLGDVSVGKETEVKDIWEKLCGNKGELPYDELKPGSAVFKKKGEEFTHIGVYIGGGKVVEAKSVKMGVGMSAVTSGWDAWGELSAVNYSGKAVRKMVEEPKPDTRILSGNVSVYAENGNRVNVREDKSVSAVSVDSLPVGIRVEVLEDCGEFCKIQYTKTGYMMKKFLKGM